MQSSILLVGGTGFIGKVVLERILATTPAMVSLLVRPKRGMTPEERFEELRKLPCFTNVNVQRAFQEDRVQLVSGDVTKPELGIRFDDKQALTSKLTNIISLAAAVDFDLPIQQAANSNITSALSTLELARDCQQLDSFVHCSTAYTNLPKANNGAIPEGRVEGFGNGYARQVYDTIKNGVSTSEEQRLLQERGYPNTYTFTKAMAEQLLLENRGSVPLVFVRPSVVTACYQHPQPGWIDSRAAYAAFISLYGSGFMHTVSAKADAKPDIVPCDYVADRLIRGALDTSLDKKSQTPVIHATAGLEHSLTCGELVSSWSKFFDPKKHHTQQRPYLRVLAESSNPKTAASFQMDKLKVQLLKGAATLFGKKKAAKTLDRVSVGLDKMQTVFPFFSHNTFNFQSKETLTDVFPNFDVTKFMGVVNMGVYCHLLGGKNKEELEPSMTVCKRSHHLACDLKADDETSSSSSISNSSSEWPEPSVHV